MRWGWIGLIWLTLVAPAAAQQPVNVLFDYDATHDGATFQVEDRLASESTATIRECIEQGTAEPNSRRCVVSLQTGATRVIRLRAYKTTCSSPEITPCPSQWSASVTWSPVGPGPFTIVISGPITIPVTHMASQLDFVHVQSPTQNANNITAAAFNGGQSGQANRLLHVMCLWRNAAGETLSSITYGGSALTLQAENVDTGIAIRTGYLLAPTGSQDVVAAFSAGPLMVHMFVRVVDGVDQTNPIEDQDYGNDNDFDNDTSVTSTSSTNGLAIDAIYLRDGSMGASLAAGGDQTDDFSDQEATFGSTAGSSHKAAGASSTTMTWTWGGFATVQAVTVTLKAAAATATSAPVAQRRMNEALFKF